MLLGFLDLSIMNILLLGAVVALFALFIIVLMKLNPSTEVGDEKLKPEPRADKPAPQTPMITPRPSQPTKTETTTRADWKTPLISNPKPSTASAQSKTALSQVKVTQTLTPQPRATVASPTLTPTRNTGKEEPQPEKSYAQKLAASRTEAPNNSYKKDCLHQFGYLRSLPKNAPIPDECFGCPRIVDCLVASKK